MPLLPTTNTGGPASSSTSSSNHRPSIQHHEQAPPSPTTSPFPPPGNPFITRYIPSTLRNHLVAVAGEFAGTFLFLFLAFGGTNAVNTAPTAPAPTTEEEAKGGTLGSDPAKLLFISLSFGLSLAVNAWIFFRVSGGLFNPAVTLGMIVVGALPIIRGILAIFSQILGAIAAAGLISALQPSGAKPGLTVSTSLSAGTSVAQGLFLEAFLTAQLMLAIFMLAGEKHRATFLAPLGIGGALLGCELVGVTYTGGSLNPARSFGPAVVTGQFDSHHWIYWVGPCLGALLASGFYALIKMFGYESANPGQDGFGDGSFMSSASYTSAVIVPGYGSTTAGGSAACLSGGGPNGGGAGGGGVAASAAAAAAPSGYFVQGQQGQGQQQQQGTGPKGDDDGKYETSPARLRRDSGVSGVAPGRFAGGPELEAGRGRRDEGWLGERVR